MEASPTPPSYAVTCPHCGREFKGPLLTAQGSPQKGFKCPHCRLFVPLDRAGEQAPTD